MTRSARRLLGGAVAASAAFFFAGCASMGGAGGGAGPLLYAPNQDDGTVSVIDIGRLEVVETVDLAELGFGGNAKPHHVVVEPDGSYWYVSLIGANAVVKLDRSNAVVGRADFEVPGMMALHPTEDVLWVGRSMSAVNPPRRIGRIDRSTLEVDELDVFISRPHGVAVAPGGDIVYTASLAENRLAAVRPREEDVELVDVPGQAHHGIVQLAVSPDGATLVATAEMTGELLVFDIGDPAAPVPVRTVALGPRPWHPVFAPDGRVFVGLKGSDQVKVLDARTLAVRTTFSGPALAAPHGAALSPAGDVVFISGNGREGGPGAVMAVDVRTMRVLAVIPLGRNVAGLGAASGT